MSGARTPIKNGFCQGDFDFNGFRALNLGADGSLSGYVPVTRKINGHQLTGDITLDLATDFGLSVSTVGLALLNLATPAANRYLRVSSLGAVSYVVPEDIPADIGLGVTNDVTFGNLFVGTDGDISGASSHFTVGKSTDSTQYLDFNNSQAMRLKNASGTGAALFVTAGLTLDRAYTLPNASGTLALTSDLVFVSDTAYDASSWNGVTTIAPSKNAVRDKIESMNPMSATGDLVYGGASGAQTRLAGNTTTTRKFLRQTGNGTISAAPAWDTVTADDVGLGATADVLFGNLFLNTNGDVSGGGSVFTLGASMDSLNYLVFENSEFLSLKDRASNFAAFFDTSLLSADRTLKTPNRAGTIAVSEWIVVDHLVSYIAKAGDKIQADTHMSAFSITLPASPIAGDAILFEDAQGTFNSKNLTLARNSKLINGAAANFVASTDDQKLSCVYIDDTYGWSIK